MGRQNLEGGCVCHIQAEKKSHLFNHAKLPVDARGNIRCALVMESTEILTLIENAVLAR